MRFEINSECEITDFRLAWTCGASLKEEVVFARFVNPLFEIPNQKLEDGY